MLHLAARHGHTKVAKLLLLRGIDVNSMDKVSIYVLLCCESCFSGIMSSYTYIMHKN